MKSVVLNTVTRFLMPLFLVFSLFLLIRGHNEPGGGFIGGLVAAGALLLHALAFGNQAVVQALRLNTRTIFAIGLLLSLSSAFVSLFVGKEFMSGVWVHYNTFLGHIEFGTPLLFDIGVYFVVIGVVLTIVLTLMEEEE